MEKEELHIFRVSIGDTSSEGCHQREYYQLVVKNNCVCLCDVKNNGVILEWPYAHIRRYGRTPVSFSIDAGRRSESGDGIFEMHTSEAEIIMARIEEKVKRLMDKDVKKAREKRKLKANAELPPLPTERNTLQPPNTRHDYTNVQLHGQREILQQASYANTTVRIDKEAVIIDDGEVFIDKQKTAGPAAKTHLQRYTPMMTSTKQDQNKTNPPPSDYYMNAPTENVSDFDKYITPVFKTSR